MKYKISKFHNIGDAHFTFIRTLAINAREEFTHHAIISISSIKLQSYNYNFHYAYK